MTDLTPLHPLADTLAWAASNVETWRPFAIAALAAVYLAALAWAAAVWEDMDR